MILKSSLAAAVLFGAIVLLLRWQSSVDAAGSNVVIAERVLRAVEAEDYDAFIAQADQSVRKMRIEHFHGAAHVCPRAG